MPEVFQTLGFGGAAISSMKSYGSAIRLLSAAYDSGITHFDTAPLYGQGYSEKLFGNFIRNKRDKISLTTKVGLGNPGPLSIPAFIALPLNYYKKAIKRNVPTAPKSSVSAVPQHLSHRQITVDYIKTSFEGSLKRLQTDRIDYYFIHEAVPSFLGPGALEFLLAMRIKGKLGALGIATGSQNLLGLSADEVQYWDVLQYEAGNNAATLRHRYPGKKHFLHSCLKDLGTQRLPPGISAEMAGGYQLAACVKDSRPDKLLFSTRRITVLQKNLEFFERFMKQ